MLEQLIFKGSKFLIKKKEKKQKCLRRVFELKNMFSCNQNVFFFF